MYRVVSRLILCFMASGSTAQLGSDQDQCKEVWGTPRSGTLDSQGNGTLKYAQRETDITLDFAEGVVWNAVYIENKLDEKGINSLLKLNSYEGRNTWTIWTPPGVPESDVEAAMWMCDDETGMAFFRDGNLNVKGMRGTPQPEKPQVTETSDSPVKESPAIALEQESEPTEIITAPKVVKRAPKPSKPSTMPVLGDTKLYTMQLLGEPSGIMESGGKEILVYGWGSVWFANGKVCKIN